MIVIFKALKWILSLFMGLFALVAFSAGGIAAGFLFLLLGVVINPLMDGIYKKHNISVKRIISIPSILVLFIVACFITPTTYNPEKDINAAALSMGQLATDAMSSDEVEGITRNREQAEQEIKAEKEEEERLAKEQAEQEEKERIAKEQAEKEEEERLAKEQAEQERLAKEQAEKNEQQERVVQEQDNSQNQNAAGGDASNFNTYNNPEQQNTTAQWVLNVSTRKIHYPSCKDVKRIAPDNYSTSDLSVDELCAQGYSTCGHCFR